MRIRLLLTVVAGAMLLSSAAGGQAVGPLTIEGTHLTATDSLPVFIDRSPPVVQFTSPVNNSTIAADFVTVTGVARDARSQFTSDDGILLGDAEYTVRDSNFVAIGQGTVPLVDGRFTINNIPIGQGEHRIEVRITDAAGLVETGSLRVVSDPGAPGVFPVSPRDGESVFGDVVAVDLNFLEAATIVSVNGLPDGRSFPAGLALDAISVSLQPGPNTIVLEVDFAGSVVSASFALFRFAEPEAPTILFPANGASVNTPTIVVSGRVPLGTPFVEVNGIPATIGPDLVSFSAEIPTPDPREGTFVSSIQAESFPFRLSDDIQVRPDFVPPVIVDLVPESDGIWSEAALPIFGLINERANVTIEGGANGPVSLRTIGGSFLFGFSNSPTMFPEFPGIFPRFEAEVELQPGLNNLTLRITDDAGNETVAPLAITQTEAALGLVSPTPGIPVPAFRTDVTLQALQSVIVDSWFAAGRRIPALGGQTISAGTHVFSDVPLLPGLNEMRVVYRRRPFDPPEIVLFDIESSATGVASISGTVTDVDTGDPVGGALVTATVNGITIVTVGDNQGLYGFEVEPGAIGGIITAEGFSAEAFNETVGADQTVLVDVALDETGLPALMNELEIVAPPDGTVTDFEAVTVTGVVLNPATIISVNGVSADVSGNRFIAKNVPLAMGANVLVATAVVPGSPTATHAVSVERSTEPVLAVTVISPPDGATVPGAGLVVRGFVSAKEANVIAGNQLVTAEGGAFAAYGLSVPEGDSEILVHAATLDDSQEASTSVAITATSGAQVAVLETSPSGGNVPLTTELRPLLLVPFEVERIDFDYDSDDLFDSANDQDGVATAVYDFARPNYPRVILTTPQGVEMSAAATVTTYLPELVGVAIAGGNPIDIERVPGGYLVLDGAAAEITEFDRDGAVVRTVDLSGELSAPRRIGAAGEDEIFVADPVENRVVRFSRDGVFLGDFVPTDGAPPLSSPCAVQVSAGRVFVSECDSGLLRSFQKSTGAPIQSALLNAPGLGVVSGLGVATASPSTGVFLMNGEGVLNQASFLEDRPADQVPLSPVDISSGSDGFVISDAGENALLVYDQSRLFRRRLSLPRRPIAAIMSPRRDQQAVLVVDGTELTEIVLPVPSPLPIFSSFRAALIAGDVAGALDRVHPVQEGLFAEIFSALGPNLTANASAMQGETIGFLREDRATLKLKRVVDGVELTFPVYMIRNEVGEWQVLDY